MTDQLYRVGWSPSSGILDVVMIGFWSNDDVKAFSIELRNTVAQVGCIPFDMIADLAALGPQSQAVVALQGDVIAGLVSARMHRLVIVGASPLLTMQVKRAAAPLIPHFTATEREAREWLAGST